MEHGERNSRMNELNRLFSGFILLTLVCILAKPFIQHPEKVSEKIVPTRVEHLKVDVLIEDATHKSSSRVMDSGKYCLLYIPESYSVTVKYKGRKYSISGKDNYEKYKDLIGLQAIGILEAQHYTDGHTEESIISLK